MHCSKQNRRGREMSCNGHGSGQPAGRVENIAKIIIFHLLHDRTAATLDLPAQLLAHQTPQRTGDPCRYTIPEWVRTNNSALTPCKAEGCNTQLEPYRTGPQTPQNDRTGPPKIRGGVSQRERENR